MTKKSIILLEFNELTPSVMDHFIAMGHLPNFARLRSQSQVYVTDAMEKPPNLEPWIQWPTVHSGLGFSEHGVFNLGDAAKIHADAIWDIASANGKRVWVCGSMNAFHRPGLTGWLLPDPWSVNVRPSDAKLLPYFDFVRSQVMEYTRTKTALEVSKIGRFLTFMLRNGLRFSTIAAIASQVLREVNANVRWQRAVILDRLQFDLFRSYYKRHKPEFSTFFLNSTAHFQHVYWRNMDPAPFSIKPSAQEQRDFAAAVLLGYQSMDRIVGEVLELADDDTAVVMASALGQQPCTTYEKVGGKSFYKPDNYERLLRVAGIDPASCSVEPVMSEQFHLRFKSAEHAIDGCERLERLTVDGRKALSVAREASSVLAGCAVFQEVAPDAMLLGPEGSRRFADVFYFVDTKKSGMHHPEGILWMAVPGLAPAIHPGSVPLVDVAPTLLSLLGLPAPSGLPGRSLLGSTVPNSAQRRQAA
jgi:hypothetical protein